MEVAKAWFFSAVPRAATGSQSSFQSVLVVVVVLLVFVIISKVRGPTNSMAPANARQWTEGSVRAVCAHTVDKSPPGRLELIRPTHQQNDTPQEDIPNL